MSTGALPEDVRHITVQTTVETAEEADHLASAVVEARLAACVQISEVRSLYRWEGQVQQDPELLITLKTASARWDELQAFIEEHHPYEEPELIVAPIIGGSASYLDWLTESTTSH